MRELIWVGNTLLPRGLVWLSIALAALTVVGLFVWLTDGGGKR